MDQSVKILGNDYFKQSFFTTKKKQEKMVYNKNMLQIGWIVKNGKITTDIKRLDIKESFRAVGIGATRSGKTFLIREISDRYASLGNAVVHLNDTKNEMHSSNYPVQEKFHHLLAPGETPTGFKMLTLRPTFFRQIDKTLAKDNYWYSVDGRCLTRADFMTLMNVSSLPPNQQTAMEIIYQDMVKCLSEDENLFLSVDLFNQIIDSEDMAPATQRSLKFKFKPLESSHFFVKEEEKNIANAIRNGFIPTVNVENFDSFGDGSFQFTEVILSMIFREIRLARRAKKIKRVLVVFDEASRFIGNSRETSIKAEMLSSHDLDTRYGIDLCLQKDTLVRTNNGDKKIKDLDEEKDVVMSFNFEKDKWEESNFKKIYTGKKKLMKIKLGNKEVLCSKDHKFFVKQKNEIVEKTASELRVDDELVSCTQYDGLFNPIYGGHSKKAIANIKKVIKEKRGEFKGKNNPNYGNKWCEEKKLEQSNMVKDW